MGLYPQSIIDDIRDRVSIASYIGEHITLKKMGRNFKGLCPFHSEKTPSFMVSDEKEIFHCFGCGEGGNIFTFVMKYEGLNFVEAVKHLAARAGVTLPEKTENRGSKNEDEEAQKRKELYFKINKFVATFFTKALTEGSAGEHARNYLISRGISAQNITQHFLGYADDKWDTLYRSFKENNVPLDTAAELGLIKKSEKRGDYFDFFRSRLIFPIISQRGEVLGFGGRVIDNKDAEAAKYLNSPDSMIYHKSNSVYALDVAGQEIRKADSVIIVEGYMDVLALNEAGIKNVVAPLGTALTMSHVRLLGRYSKNMVLIFDGDGAGVAAAERSLPVFLEGGLIPKMVLLPNGMDPDDWIKKNSREEFERMVADSETLLSWFIKRKALESGSDISKKFSALSGMRPLLDKLTNSLEFAYYKRLMAEQFRVQESDLKFEKAADISIKNIAAGKTGAEKMVIELLLSYPDLIARAGMDVNGADFDDRSLGDIFDLLRSEAAKGKVSTGRLIDSVADESLKDAMYAMSVNESIEETEKEAVFADCMKYLAKRRARNRLKEITEGIKKAELVKDDSLVAKLVNEKNELLRENVL